MFAKCEYGSGTRMAKEVAQCGANSGCRIQSARERRLQRCFKGQARGLSSLAGSTGIVTKAEGAEDTNGMGNENFASFLSASHVLVPQCWTSSYVKGGVRVGWNIDY